MFLELPKDKLLPEDTCVGPSIDVSKVLDNAVDNPLIVEIKLWCFGELLTSISGDRRQERKHKGAYKNVEIPFDLSDRDACHAAKCTLFELCTIVERKPRDRLIKLEERFFFM